MTTTTTNNTNKGLCGAGRDWKAVALLKVPQCLLGTAREYRRECAVVPPMPPGPHARWPPCHLPLPTTGGAVIGGAACRLRGALKYIPRSRARAYVADDGPVGQGRGSGVGDGAGAVFARDARIGPDPDLGGGPRTPRIAVGPQAPSRPNAPARGVSLCFIPGAETTHPLAPLEAPSTTTPALPGGRRVV